MAVEYILVLLMSSFILAGAFGLAKGPVGMFKESSPYLAYKVQSNLMTGEKFIPATDEWE